MYSIASVAKGGALLCLAATAACTATVGPAGGDAGDTSSDARTFADATDGATTGRERCNGRDDDGDGKVDEGCPIRLTRDPRDDVESDLQGGRLVWNNAGVTYLRTLPDGDAQRLPYFCAGPSLWAGRLACVGDGEYLVYDLASGTRTRIDTTGATSRGPVKLFGDVVAWTQGQIDTDSENSEIYTHDLRTGVTSRITDDPAISYGPRIDGRTIVWTDDRRGHHAIGLAHQFDVFTESLDAGPTEQALTQRAGDLQIGPVMGFEGARVLATDIHQPWIAAPPPAQCQPVFYDLHTGARTELSPLAERCDEAGALSGHRVAVLYDRLGVSDIFVIDVSTHERRRITNYPRRSERPLLDGDLLVWSDDRNDNWDLYMMDVSDIERGDLSPEGVTP